MNNALIALADKLGRDGRNFRCPKCQVTEQTLLFGETKAPAAVLLPLGRMDDCSFWRCLSCGTSGTAATIRRLVDQSVPLAQYGGAA